MAGELAFFELGVADVEKARAFYQARAGQRRFNPRRQRGVRRGPRSVDPVQRLPQWLWRLVAGGPDLAHDNPPRAIARRDRALEGCRPPGNSTRRFFFLKGSAPASVGRRRLIGPRSGSLKRPPAAVESEIAARRLPSGWAACSDGSDRPNPRTGAFP